MLASADVRGIGARIARAFAEADSRPHVCDIDRAAIDRRTTLGGLEVLIDTAGIAGPTGPIEEIPPNDWERTIAGT